MRTVNCPCGAILRILPNSPDVVMCPRCGQRYRRRSLGLPSVAIVGIVLTIVLAVLSLLGLIVLVAPESGIGRYAEPQRQPNCTCPACWTPFYSSRAEGLTEMQKTAVQVRCPMCGAVDIAWSFRQMNGLRQEQGVPQDPMNQIVNGMEEKP